MQNKFIMNTFYIHNELKLNMKILIHSDLELGQK